MTPLASFGDSQFRAYTNMSTSIALSVFDEYQNEISLQTNLSEIRIPRDPNLFIPEMNLQDVTSNTSFIGKEFFRFQSIHLREIQPNKNLTISLHFQFHPLVKNLSYLFIYRFDHRPELTNSNEQLDGWTLFCPANLTDEDDLYTYYIDNQQTSDHREVIFGLRELTSIEMESYCSNASSLHPPITNKRVDFTSNYEIRIYSSGCYYLDQFHNWQSDGLLVGPLTNTSQTQCFTTRL